MVVDQPTPSGRTPSAASVAVPKAQFVPRQTPLMRVDFSAGIDAVTAPRVPKDMGRGLFVGAMAMAEGYKDIGKFLTDVGLSIGKAQTIKQTDDADIEMQRMQGEFRAWQETAPPEAWSDEWINRSKTLHETLMAPETLTGPAREHIDAKWRAFDVNGNVEVQVGRAKKAYGDARSSTIRKAEKIAAQGQPGESRKFMEEEGRAQFTTPDDRDRMEEVERESARANDIALIPDKVMEWLNNPAGEEVPDYWKTLAESPAQTVDARNAAVQSKLGQKSDVFRYIKGQMQSGKVKTVEDVKKMEGNEIPKGILEPGDYLAVEQTITGGVPDRAEFNSLLAETRAVDPNAPDAPMQIANLRFKFSKLPQAYETQLTDELNKVEEAGEPGPMVLSYGDKILQGLHDDEGFTDAKGNPIRWKQGKFLWGSATEGGALDDYEKMKALGFSKEQVATLKKIPGQAKLETAKSMMTQIKKDAEEDYKFVMDEDAFAKLKPFTRDLLTQAFTSPDYENPLKRNESAGVQSQLMQELRKAHTLKPFESSSAVMQWIIENTQGSRRLKGSGVLMNHGPDLFDNRAPLSPEQLRGMMAPPTMPKK